VKVKALADKRELLDDSKGEQHGKGFIIGPNDPILVTGASGFIGSRLIEALLDLGFSNLRCFVRPSSDVAHLEAVANRCRRATVQVIRGNLLSREDCIAATKDAAVIFHLARARGNKSFPDAFMNSVVTTRNLLEASLHENRLKRFVNISSFSVYANTHKSWSRLLDESSPVETHAHLRGEAYCFAKTKQDQIVEEYGNKFGIPYVTVRPGYVYGPGNTTIPSRVGIDTFGVFLHLGGSNSVPLTYIDNCVEAIALAGLKMGVKNEVFNIVEPNVLEALQTERRAFQVILCPPFDELWILLPMGALLSLVEGTVAPRVQSQKVARILEKDELHERKGKDAVGLDAKNTYERGAEALLRRLSGNTTCLESP
jgi:nucleoside-diphosphate-sugar epimerase